MSERTGDTDGGIAEGRVARGEGRGRLARLFTGARIDAAGRVLLAAYVAVWLSGCNQLPEDLLPVLPVSRIADGGFARDPQALARWEHKEIRLSGYVDHGNLYGGLTARRILQDRWAGDGPAPGVWRFDLKAWPDDPVGRSFAVRVPDDPGSGDLLRRMAADARAQRPTKVVVTGRLHRFDAPTQAAVLTGLKLVVRSSADVRIAPAERRRAR
jgi:hypothetical protein